MSPESNGLYYSWYSLRSCQCGKGCNGGFYSYEYPRTKAPQPRFGVKNGGSASGFLRSIYVHML